MEAKKALASLCLDAHVEDTITAGHGLGVAEGGGGEGNKEDGGEDTRTCVVMTGQTRIQRYIPVNIHAYRHCPRRVFMGLMCCFRWMT